MFLFLTNSLLTKNLGLVIAAGGSLEFTQILFIAMPSTIAGYLIGSICAYPIIPVLIPLAILFGRGVEDISDPLQEKCRLLCKVAEQYHNKELNLKMENLGSAVEKVGTQLQPPSDKLHLVCTEQPLPLLQRYKLKLIIKSQQAQKRVEYFSEFIKKSPEWNADPTLVYEEILELKEKVKIS